MRILIAAHGFPPTHSAGAERRAERMARWLSSHGHEVTVFAIEHLDHESFEDNVNIQDGFVVHRLSYNINDGDYFHNMYDYAPVGQAFRDLLKANAFDLVHIVSGYLLGGQIIDAAKDAGLPTILTLTEYWFMCVRLNLIRPNDELCSGPETYEKCMRCILEEKRRYRVPAQVMPHVTDAVWKVAQHLPSHQHLIHEVEERQETLHQALDRVDRVICPSKFLMSKFAEFEFDTSHYSFMRQGINKPRGPKPHVKHPHDGVLRLVYIGQVDQHKGVDLLIDAVIGLLQEGRKVELDLWGADNGTPDYTTLVKHRSEAYDAIHWRGRYEGNKVWEVLAAADAMVIPSRWYENSPNSILESYEMGVPVIATKLGGMAELVEHEQSGLLFELNDVDDLRTQIVRLMDEPDLLNKLKAGLMPVLTIDEEMRALVDIYQGLVQPVQNSGGKHPLSA